MKTNNQDKTCESCFYKVYAMYEHDVYCNLHCEFVRDTYICDYYMEEEEE